MIRPVPLPAYPRAAVTNGFLAQEGGLCVDEPCHEGQLDDDDRQHDVDHAVPEHADDREAQEDHREGEKDVQETHDAFADPAQKIAGDHAERHADDDRDDRRRDADEKRHPWRPT